MSEQEIASEKLKSYNKGYEDALQWTLLLVEAEKFDLPGDVSDVVYLCRAKSITAKVQLEINRIKERGDLIC